MSYESLAPHYDRLMAHVDYEAWVRFVAELMGLRLQKGGTKPRLLDLACGTGTFAVAFSQMGYEVIAIDASLEMLAVAEEKARRSAAGSILFTRQDLTEFVVDEPADGAVSLFDSLNYLIEDGALEKAFERVAEALRPGALFLFDLNTEARLRFYGESLFVLREEEIAYIWESEYDEERKVCAMHLTLFVEREEAPPGTYARFDEVHLERAYDPDHVISALGDAGFKLEGVFGELERRPPAPDEGRCFYLARKE